MKTFREYLAEADQQTTGQPVPAQQPPAVTPDDGPGVGFDNAEKFKDAIRQRVGQSDPEINAQLDRIVVAEPDGSIDADQTIYNMLKVMDTEVIPQIVQFVKDMIAKFTELTKSPEFQQASPEDQQSVMQSIKDMQATLPTIEKQAADTHAQLQQNEPMMQQNIKDRKMNQELKGPAPVAQAQSTPPVQENAELDRWLKIAGLK